MDNETKTSDQYLEHSEKLLQNGNHHIVQNGTTEKDIAQSTTLLNGDDRYVQNGNGIYSKSLDAINEFSVVTTKAVEAQKDRRTTAAKSEGEWVLLLKTFCIYCSFIGLGFSSGTLGPTLVHIEIMYRTDTQGMSIAMVGVCVGYLLGSIFTGLVFDRFNRTLQCALGTLGLGLSLISAPQMNHLYFFHACITLMAFCQGYVYSAGSPFIIELWNKSKLKAPVMQGIHAIWAVGSFSCPFIAVPFLVDIPQWYYEQTHVDEYQPTTDDVMVTHVFNETANITELSSGIMKKYPKIQNLEDVRYVYMFAGGVSIFTSCLYFITFFATGPSLLRKPTAQAPINEKDKKEKDVTEYTNGLANNRQFKIVFVSCAFLYCNIYYWYDYVPGNLLSAFVIKGLHWHARYGALITSMFWGSFGVGRMLGVPASYFISPSIMLTFNVLGATTGFILLGVGAYVSDALVWVSVALMGLSTATTLPTLMLWTSKFLSIDGRLGSMFLIASSTGGLSGAVLIGYLFESSHMWLVYLCGAACVVNFVLFVFMCCAVRYFKRRLHCVKANCGVIEVNVTQ